MKEMNEELVSKVKKVKEMERMVAYNDSEIIEMMENSTVMEMEEESTFTVKELEEQSALIVEKMKDMEAESMENSRDKEIKVKNKGTNYFNFNRICIVCMLMCVAIWMNMLMQVENLKTFHDQLP
ncbi:hypothetical protein HAX54_002378 [Datura stramonium]|uniref:Transmembrane protein n=1 Tax=Datura stramonium TaxID=4076 RepID=A0ABS8T3T2_DATST|nr:hypothetical protein [Datura stramonium]